MAKKFYMPQSMSKEAREGLMKKILYIKGPATLRFNIDGSWTAVDMALFFSSMTKLYRYYKNLDSLMAIVDEYIQSEIRYAEIHHVSLSLYDHLDNLLLSFNDNWSKYFPGELMVKEIIFSSPGHTDFFGIAKIIEQISKIVFHYFPNDQQKAETEKLIQETNAQYIKNLKELGIDQHIMQQLFLREKEQLNNIEFLILQGKIKSIEK